MSVKGMLQHNVHIGDEMRAMERRIVVCRVRLRGKGAHRDTLFFKSNFEAAAAEYAARESGIKRPSSDVGPQLSPEWHKMRDARLTASTFGNALG